MESRMKMKINLMWLYQREMVRLEVQG